MSARSDFLAAHPAFAKAYHLTGTTGDTNYVMQFLKAHPQIAQAWGSIGKAAVPAAAPAPAAGGFSSAAPVAPGSSLSATDRDWVDQLTALFKANGLESLAGVVTGLVQQNYAGSALTLALQDSDAYRQRFSANEKRKAAGLPVLSPAEYLATEGQYRQVMAQAGLPAGFYDDPSDFSNFLAQDKSPAEIQERVQAHVALAKKTDPAYRKMLSDTFGIGLTDGDIAAFTLDSARALPLLQRQVESVGIADAARQNGLGYSAARAGQLAEAGVTGAQAQQAYGAVAEEASAFGRAAAAFGGQFGQADAEDEQLLGLASAKRKRDQLEGAFTAYNSGSSTSAKGANAKDSSSSY